MGFLSKTDHNFHISSKVRNTKGFSLVSTMLAAGLLGLTVLSLSSTVLIPKKETHFLNQQFLSANLKRSILETFENRQICPCQLNIPSTPPYPPGTTINTTITTPQSINLTEFKDSCDAKARVIASDGMDMGKGMVIDTMQLVDLVRTPLFFTHPSSPCC